MTDAIAKASIQSLNNKLAQYSKHLDIVVDGVIKHSKEYQDIISLATATGLELNVKGNYMQISAGQDNLKKVTEDFVERGKAIATWGKTKDMAVKRIGKDNLKGKNRQQQEEEITRNITERELKNELIQIIFDAVYEWEKSHRGFTISTFTQNKATIWAKTYGELQDLYRQIKAEMTRGGTSIDSDIMQVASELASELGI